MKEVRFHGRGGQGVVTAARILASAMFNEGKNVQAFPIFGLERRGSPVEAFLRYASGERIPVRTYVHNPDYIVIFDSTLLRTVNVLQGLKRNGLILINSSVYPLNHNLKAYRVAVVNATSISLKTLGVPIVNTAMCGAFASASGEVSLSSVIQAIRERFPSDFAEKNVSAALEGYSATKIHNFT